MDWEAVDGLLKIHPTLSEIRLSISGEEGKGYLSDVTYVFSDEVYHASRHAYHGVTRELMDRLEESL
jgi:hypothetical protein